MKSKITKFSYEKGEGLVAWLLLDEKLSPIHQMYSITIGAEAEGGTQQPLMEVESGVESMNFHSSVLKTEYIGDKKTSMKIKITDSVLFWLSQNFKYIFKEVDFGIELIPIK